MALFLSVKNMTLMRCKSWLSIGVVSSHPLQRSPVMCRFAVSDPFVISCHFCASLFVDALLCPATEPRCPASRSGKFSWPMTLWIADIADITCHIQISQKVLLHCERQYSPSLSAATPQFQTNCWTSPLHLRCLHRQYRWKTWPAQAPSQIGRVGSQACQTCHW